MKARIAELIGIAIIGAAMIFPAPTITVHSPTLLYAMAMYKAASGDTDSALRLFREAESGSERAHAGSAHPVPSQCQEPL